MNNKYNIQLIDEVKDIYTKIKPDILDRLREFDNIKKNGTPKKFFIELTFCLCTPQSSARTCWRAVDNLIRKDFLFNGTIDDIREELNIVRFRNNKASCPSFVSC